MTYDDGRNGMRRDNNMMGWILGAIALAIVLGGLMFMMTDRTNTTALNSESGVTTGSTTTAPARPAPTTPPASPSK